MNSAIGACGRGEQWVVPACNDPAMLKSLQLLFASLCNSMEGCTLLLRFDCCYCCGSLVVPCFSCLCCCCCCCHCCCRFVRPLFPPPPPTPPSPTSSPWAIPSRTVQSQYLQYSLVESCELVWYGMLQSPNLIQVICGSVPRNPNPLSEKLLISTEAAPTPNCPNEGL